MSWCNSKTFFWTFSLSILTALSVARAVEAQVERSKPLFMGVKEKAYQAPTAPLVNPLLEPNLLRDIQRQLQFEGRHLYKGAAIVPRKGSQISEDVAAPATAADLIFVAGAPTNYATQSVDGWTLTLHVQLRNGHIISIDFDSKAQDLVTLDEVAQKLRMNQAEAVRLGEFTRYKLSPPARGNTAIQDVELVLTPFTLVPHKTQSRAKAANDSPPFRIVQLPSVVITGVSQVQEFLNVSSSCSFYLDEFLMTGKLF